MTADYRWRPLSDLTVVDLTRMVPGGTATLLLADLGARVIKIENPLGGDETRSLEPRVGVDSSAQHQYMDRGKTSIRTDLKTTRGRQQVLDLIAGADAVIESFRPGVAERLGIGFTAAVEVKSDVVYLSLSGYGQHGPRSEFAGHDLDFMAYAGLVDDVPITLQADVAGGMIAALGILAGVSQVRRSGQPVHLDLALSDAALMMGGLQLSERLAAHTMGVKVATPLDGNSPCYQVYSCADSRQLAVAAIETKFWTTIVNALGRPEWQSRQHDPSLIAELAAVFAAQPRAHWTSRLEAAGTCVAPVADIAELLADPQVAARGSLIAVASDAGPLWQVAPPLRDISVRPGP